MSSCSWATFPSAHWKVIWKPSAGFRKETGQQSDTNGETACCRPRCSFKTRRMKLKLNMEDMTDDFFEDTRLLGLVAPVKDYQFCWQLNNRLRFDFRINNDIEIQLTKRQRRYYFGVFEYHEKDNSL